MSVLRSLALAFSCFSAVPMPQLRWDDRNMRYLMACFPVVGLLVGAAVALWCLACDVGGAGPFLRGVGIALVPAALTGGIHLDGLADVVDALASHAPADRRRAILKDPHIGAFAAMGVAAYLLLYAGVASELPRGWQAAVLLGCVHVAVRCESGFASVALGGAAQGMLASFRRSADKRATLAALCAEYALVAGAMLAVAPLPAAAALACGLACLAALPPFATRAFGGMTGDVAGFFLQACELVMLIALAASLGTA